MAYAQYQLSSITAQIATLLDDSGDVYWTNAEKVLAIQEALRVWGALTNFWRSRGSFPTVAGTAYYDLSSTLSSLRTRTWTLTQLTEQIQYHLLEAANGIGGSGMSGQVSIGSILNSIQRARNRFALDVQFPFTIATTVFNSAPTGGLAAFPAQYLTVHRLQWMDKVTGIWTNLIREDAWSADHANVGWTNSTGQPVAYSESESAPLAIQLYPPPPNGGTLETTTVNPLIVNIASGSSTFSIPDEWVHALKYFALADLFSNESQLADPTRAQYCWMRYKQAVDLALNGRSVMRLIGPLGAPLDIDTLFSLDVGIPSWKNQTTPPPSFAIIAGVLYDYVALYPVPSSIYTVYADVIQSAPIPTSPTDYIQVGAEDVPEIINYAVHYLAFKCGGKEFQSTFPLYDSFMGAASRRGLINQAKIRYLRDEFGQPQKEKEQRPDTLRMKETANA